MKNDKGISGTLLAGLPLVPLNVYFAKLHGKCETNNGLLDLYELHHDLRQPQVETQFNCSHDWELQRSALWPDAKSYGKYWLSIQFIRQRRMIGAMKRKASLSFSEGISIGNNNNNTTGGVGSNGNGHPKPEKRIRWDGPRTQSLIDHYRNHDYLWNPKLADYKNDKKRTQCLENWLEQNHFDRDLVNEVKMKLHGLRTSFGHQLKLEYASASESDRGGRGLAEDCGPFVSKWQWYNQLSFLKETMTFRTASSNNNSQSPVDSPPAVLDHGHLHPQMAHHEDPDNVKIEIPSNAPLNMQVMSHYSVQHPENHGGDYVMQQTHHHGHSQPHNLTVSGVPISVQIHDHQTIIPHSRKDEDDPMSYHHARMTPPMAHMQSITSQHNQQPTVAHSQPDIPRFQNACCSCNCTDRERPRLTIAEKLGRLVEETMNNLHPEYQEMTRIEIQQVLGKYLQKPIP